MGRYRGQADFKEYIVLCRKQTTNLENEMKQKVLVYVFIRSTHLSMEPGPAGWSIFGHKKILKTVCTLGEQEKCLLKAWVGYSASG